MWDLHEADILMESSPHLAISDIFMKPLPPILRSLKLEGVLDPRADPGSVGDFCFNMVLACFSDVWVKSWQR